MTTIRVTSSRFRPAAAHFRAQKSGTLIGFTSGAFAASVAQANYSVAKGGIVSLVRSAAAGLHKYGVTANMVHPPVTDTGWVTDTVRRAVEQSSTLVHIARPEEVAEVIVYLCSDAARLVSGNVLNLR